MRNIKLLVEYDGTGFSGYQSQSNADRTVQDTLEEAICRLTGSFERATVAGRTDAGVHAHGQVINFKTECPIPIERVAGALNRVLPIDIGVRSASDAPQSFHSRFSAVERTYIYGFWLAEQRSAFWCRYMLHQPSPLDFDLMRDAARQIIGTRHFGAFANAGGDPGATDVRRLRTLDIRVSVRRKAAIVVVTANAFLRAMVRNIVGALLCVGKNELSPAGLSAIVRTGDRTQNRCPTAPPHGLCLWRVLYDVSDELKLDDRGIHL